MECNQEDETLQPVFAKQFSECERFHYRQKLKQL